MADSNERDFLTDKLYKLYLRFALHVISNYKLHYISRTQTLIQVLDTFGGASTKSREFKQIATAGADTAAGSKFPQK